MPALIHFAQTMELLEIMLTQAHLSCI